MNPPYRIGFGFDVHRLEQDRKFILGGVEISNDKGIAGHSDADVLIHAICDALLGAAGLRDIGFHFPDTDPQFKDADSSLLLKEVCHLLYEKHFTIGNIDSTVVVEAPRINPYIENMKNHLAAVMGIAADQISIKATTNEQLGFIGREEGISAYAVTIIFYSGQ